MQASTILNNQLLPPEVSANSGTWFGRARSYPIFSPAWYRYRSLAVLTGSALVFLVLAAMLGASMVNAPAMEIDWISAAQMTILIALPFCTLCLAGPGMAVAVRRMGWRTRRETIAILLALTLGMALSAGLELLLVAGYEKMQIDLANDIIVERTLPAVQLNVQAKPGETRYFRGLRPARHAPVPAQQLTDLQARAAAAGKLPAAQEAPFAYLGPQAQGAIENMRKLDAGDPAIDPARRPEIEQQYADALGKYTRHPRGMFIFGADQHQAPTPQAAALPAAQDNPLSRQLGRFASALVGIAAVLLAFWLGGLFDLVAFVRQRGKLVDVLQKEELQRAQAARNTAEMRLSVLAAQVEPHFLFNTLASVRSAISSDPQRATQIVDHMVSFLRSTIPQMRDDAGSATVKLATQLDSARSYLALMHERIPRLQFAVEAEPGLEHASIPPLMLISLVENAVKHGVEPKIGPARIVVRARRIDNDQAQLEVCVSDDGVGFGEATSGDGIGLANIQERLRSYYGQRASLTLKALPDGGVAAILQLPLSFET